MIVRAIEVEGVRCFSDPFQITFDPDAITVLPGPNGFGKSTLFEAMRRVLTSTHTTANAADLRPWFNHRTPQITLEFEHGGSIYRITKRFLDKPFARLEKKNGQSWSTIETGRNADEAVLGMISAGKKSDEGLLAVLWSAQGKLPYGGAPKGVVETVRESLGGQMTGASGAAFEATLAKEFADSFTPSKRQPKKGKVHDLDEDLATKRQLKQAAETTLAEADRHQVVARENREERDNGRRTRAGFARLLEEAETDAQAFSRVTTAVSELLRGKGSTFALLMAVEQRIASIRREREDIAKLEAIVPDNVASLELRRGAHELAQAQSTQAMASLATASKSNPACLQALARVTDAQEFVDLQRELAATEQLKAQIEGFDCQWRGLQAECMELRSPDRKALARVRSVVDQARDTRVRLEASELHLSLSVERAMEIEVSAGEPAGVHSVANGSTWAVTGDAVIAFRLPGIAAFRVTGPETNAAELRKYAEEAEASLATLAAPFGTSNLDELTLRTDRLIEIQAEQATIGRQRAKLLGKSTVSGLTSRHKDLSAKRDALLTKQPSWGDDVPDVPLLRAEAARLREEYDCRKQAAQDDYMRAMAAASTAESDLKAATSNIAGTRERLAAARIRLQDHESDGLTVEGRAEDAERVRRELEKLTSKLASAQQELARLPKDAEEAAVHLKQQLLALDQTISRADHQVTEHETARRILLSQGAYSNLSEAEEQITALEQELERESVRIDALKLLFETVEQEKAKALDGVTVPVSARATELLAEIAGQPLAEIHLPDDFSADFKIVVSGTSKEIGLLELSGGEQEQIALAVRLALAEHLTGSDRQLVVLDDVLLNTDDRRLARILAILDRMRPSIQFVLLTCHPERYTALNGATHVEMAHSLAAVS